MGERTQDVRSVFTAVVALDTPEERARHLDETCRGRPELRQRVEELLRAHDRDDPWFDKGGGPEPGELQEGPGTIIGHYKLLEQIGEGGFGVVFMAGQLKPVRRKVALKVVKPGMDSREVIARFETELQALALMDHPNIAKVFDAGATEGGRPYFVMELVHGVPVTEYCDGHDLAISERLALFIHICQAMQHAHQKGVIHRDLKPSNILVTRIDGEGMPKVIDFGVAKALGQQLTERTLFTAFEQMVGTPAYMSPEQTALSGTDIDTRSDVYSLGVLLYELLTGATPLDTETVHRVGLDEVRRMIREIDPPRPSTRLRTMGEKLAEVAERRHTEASTLKRFVHGDLDWIVMKALEKNRARRYQTVAALAEDVERHLAHEPVTARPPSLPYRTHKFVRRHKVGAGFVAAGAAALVVSAAALAYGLAKAQQERDRAEEEAAVSAAVNAFLLDDLLGQASPEMHTNRDVTLREMVDRAAEKADGRFRDQPPMIELQVRLTLSSVYRDLGEFDNARRELDQVIEICRQEQLAEDDPTWLQVQHSEGRLLFRTGRPEEAQKIYEKIIPLRQQVLGPEHPDTLASMNNLALTFLLQGKPAEAQKRCQELIPLEEKVHGAEHPSVLRTKLTLAEAFLRQENPEEALRIYEEVLPSWEQIDLKHTGTLMTRNGIAGCLLKQGKPAEAQAICEEVLEVIEKTLGPEHPYTLDVKENRERALRDQGMPVEE